MQKIQIGDSFGLWSVIEDAGYMNGTRKAWLCKCVCGNIKKVLQQSLLASVSTKCRICSNREKAANRFRNLSHQIFGKWTVKDNYKITKRHSVYWLCLCECGKQKFVKMDSLVSGSSTCCGDCNTYRDIHSVFWSHIINSAKRRNIVFEITKEEAWDLFEKQNKKCNLTGLPIKLGKDRKLITASLDRIDSNKGYTLDNCQWVHKIVNVIKWNLSQDDFIYFCKLVANYHTDNNYIANIDDTLSSFYIRKNRWDKI